MPVDGFLPLAAVPVIALAAALTGAMSRAGAWTGAILGVAITLGAGWVGLAMLATLLVVGTLTSDRTRRARRPLQALCNGAVAAAAALAAGAGFEPGLLVMGGALSGALSDTVSGELGRRWGGTPRMLLVGPRVVPGADGAMSGVGTLLGLAAALPIPLIGWHGDLRAAATVAVAGFAGNLVDSLVGWSLQPRLGRHGNDWTNLIATACAGALAALL